MAISKRDRLIMSFLNSDRRKPPRQNYGVTGSIPGFGDFRDSRNAKKIADATARYDKTTAPRHGRQRAPYRPGERFKRKYPRDKYNRGDFNRPHRPQVN